MTPAEWRAHQRQQSAEGEPARQDVLNKLKPGKYFSDMTEDEVRARLVELNQAMSSREMEDMRREPLGRYIPELNKHEGATEEQTAAWQAAVDALKAGAAEKKDMEDSLRRRENERKREKRRREEAESLAMIPLADAAHQGKDKTKRGQKFYADEHRAAVEAALAAGKEVPEAVLRDYPDLAKKGKPAQLSLETPKPPSIMETIRTKVRKLARRMFPTRDGTQPAPPPAQPPSPSAAGDA